MSGADRSPCRGCRAQRGDRRRQCDALAALERPQALQGADLGQAADHGAEDVSNRSARRCRGGKRSSSRATRLGPPRASPSPTTSTRRSACRRPDARRRSSSAAAARSMRRRSAARDRLFITEVELDAEGDARFPAIDPAQWREVRREKGERGPRDEADFAFVDYERVRSSGRASQAYSESTGVATVSVEERTAAGFVANLLDFRAARTSTPKRSRRSRRRARISSGLSRPLPGEGRRTVPPRQIPGPRRPSRLKASTSPYCRRGPFSSARETASASPAIARRYALAG